MGLTTMDKSLFGAGFIMIILNLAVIAPMATSAVPDAVADATATKTLDDICVNDICTKISEDWESSTSQRHFYGWSITNLDDVVTNASEPIYERIGPVTYDVTLEREYLSHDSDKGEIEYRQFTSYACAADTVVACDTNITNLNIAFKPQIIGATSTAIAHVMSLTKVGFASGVMSLAMENVQASINVSAYLDYQMYNLKPLQNAIYFNPYTAETYFMDGMFDLFNPVYGENFVDDNDDNWTANGGVHPQWIETNMTYAFEEAVGPSGEDLALRNGTGPLVFAAMGEPDCVLDNDEWNCPGSSVTLQRAQLWNYAHPTDLNITVARDWTMYGGMGKLIIDYGGLDEDWMLDTTGESVNASQRLMNFMDLEIDNDVAMNLLFGGEGTDDPVGLLATSASGTSFGLSVFDEMDKTTAMLEYGIDNDQFNAINNWSSGWLGDETSLPLILVGGEGYITASEFVNTSFGAEDPINGGYLDNSLNIGGLWQLGYLGGEAVELTPEQSSNVLFGPLGLTTSTGTDFFLYGELSGNSLPINLSVDPLDLENPEFVEPFTWNNSNVASLYGIDENAAEAMRFLLKGPMFGALIPNFLIDSFGTGPYLTQSVNAWLLGWHDPVVAWLNGDGPDDMSVGWTSLESNKTYFGSGGISTGDGTVYTICTGESSSCDKGEMVSVDGSTQLSWRDDKKQKVTFGLITPETGVEYTGGFLTGEGDLIDLSGYGIVPVVCGEEGELKGIPVNICTAQMDPLTRPIQAKLLDTDSLLDAIPGALPVYFGSEVEVKTEKLSGAIIAGESTSVFYLDTRSIWEQQTPPTMDNLTKVFQIETSGELDDEAADSLSSAVVTNQDYMTYWTNFDVWIDWVALAFWVLGVALIINGIRVIVTTKPEEAPASIFEASSLVETEEMATVEDEAVVETEEETTVEDTSEVESV